MENLTVKQIRKYCESYINYSSLDVAILELHRLLNSDNIQKEVENSIKYIQDWCKRNTIGD